MMKLLAVAALCAALVSGNSISRRALKVTGVTPDSIDANTQIFIGMYWDPTLSNSVTPKTDFDMVLLDSTDSCIVRIKGSGGGAPCYGGAGGDAALGPFDATFTRSGGSSVSFTSSDTIYAWDSTSDSANNRAGMEGILLTGITGTFKLAIYDYTSTTNGNLGRSGSGLTVKVFAGSTTAAATYTAPVTSCVGRFWNVFTLTVTGVSPLAYSLTSVNSITATPSVTFGTTATQTFERSGTRPSANC